MPLVGHLAATRAAAGIAIRFTVTNDGDDPVELTFPSALQADIVVADGDHEVWRWSDDRAFVQVVTTETLGPGESLTVEETCPAPGPGEYIVEATLLATNADVDERIVFTA